MRIWWLFEGYYCGLAVLDISLHTQYKLKRKHVICDIPEFSENDTSSFHQDNIKKCFSTIKYLK